MVKIRNLDCINKSEERCLDFVSCASENCPIFTIGHEKYTLESVAMSRMNRCNNYGEKECAYANTGKMEDCRGCGFFSV